jgi:hypothetical protein
MDVQIISFFINFITFFLAYIVVVTIAGSFRAWVAKQMGDSTGEDLGFLTLNPAAHVSPFGLVFVLLFYFGWGKHVPVNPQHIDGSWRRLKILCAFFSDTFLHIILATIMLGGLIWWFDPSMIAIVRAIVLSKNVSHLYIAHYYPYHSSLSVVLAFIFAALISLHVGLAVLEFLLNACMLFLFSVTGQSFPYMEYSIYFMIIAPLLIMWFLYGPLLMIMTNLITYGGYFLAHCIGAA